MGFFDYLSPFFLQLKTLSSFFLKKYACCSCIACYLYFCNIRFLIFFISIIFRIIELVTSHINAEKSDEVSPFAFFDVLIALQGVFIFIIFVCLPKPLKIIKRWWIAKGTLDVAAFTELESLKTNNVTILE